MRNQKAVDGMITDNRIEKNTMDKDLFACGVPKDCFPAPGKCYSKLRDAAGSQYKTECQYCGLWASLPDSTSLKVTYILECSLYGHTKRMTE